VTLTHRRCSVCNSRHHDRRSCKVLAKHGAPAKATVRANPIKARRHRHVRLQPTSKANTIRKGYR
jgi:hypothetical protein